MFQCHCDTIVKESNQNAAVSDNYSPLKLALGKSQAKYYYTNTLAHNY